MYGWVDTDNQDNALSVSVKKPISNDPYNDHAIVGTFWFREVSIFNQALEKLVDKCIRVNGEYYVDSIMQELIELKFNVKVFEIEDYICWGTPNDYRTFCYWQSFFHKALWHEYLMNNDPTVSKDKLNLIDEAYRTFEQEHG